MKREELRIRDPFVYKEDGVYYVLGTTGDDPWGVGSDFALYRTKNFSELEFVANLVEPNTLEGYSNRWAPELHRYRGKYILIVSLFREDLGRGSMILTSSSLDKPFTPLTGEYITPAHWGCLDATLFVSDGVPYLCFSNEWTTPISQDGDGSLFIARLSDDLTRLEETPKKIISGKNSNIAIEVSGFAHTGFIAEGPWLYEKDGKVILLWSTITKTGYSVVKSIASSPYGPYGDTHVIFEKDGGHCMMFTPFEGKELLTLHQPNVTPNERMQIYTFIELLKNEN